VTSRKLFGVRVACLLKTVVVEIRNMHTIAENNLIPLRPSCWRREKRNDSFLRAYGLTSVEHILDPGQQILHTRQVQGLNLKLVMDGRKENWNAAELCLQKWI